jgi:hypothetical protein
MWGRSKVLRRLVPCVAAWLAATSGCARPYGEAQDEPELNSAGTAERDAGPPRPAVIRAADAGQAPIPPPADAGTPAVVDVEQPPPAPSDVVWTGTLARVTPAEFGGAPYCPYSITFENVRVSVTLDGDGKVKAAEVNALVKEGTTPDCPNATIPPHEHTYRYATASPSLTADIPLAALSTNKPRAEGVLTTTAVTGGVRAKIRFHRVDQVAPLDWTVEATVALKAAAAMD